MDLDREDVVFEFETLEELIKEAMKLETETHGGLTAEKLLSIRRDCLGKLEFLDFVEGKGEIWQDATVYALVSEEALLKEWRADRIRIKQ